MTTSQGGKMPKPVLLADVKAEPIGEVVQVLEQALEKAKDGRIRAVAIAYCGTQGQAGWSYSTGDAPWAYLYTELSWLKREIEDLIVDGGGDV